MRLGHGLDHIRNQFTGRKGVVHPLVPHGHTIANSGNTEEKGISAAGMHTFLDEAFQVTHPDMAGDQVGKTGGHADKRLVHLALRNTGSFQKCAVRGSFKSFFYSIASHVLKPSALKNVDSDSYRITE